VRNNISEILDHKASGTTSKVVSFPRFIEADMKRSCYSIDHKAQVGAQQLVDRVCCASLFLEGGGQPGVK
jgi:hypothetical protein